MIILSSLPQKQKMTALLRCTISRAILVIKNFLRPSPQPQSATRKTRTNRSLLQNKIELFKRGLQSMLTQFPPFVKMNRCILFLLVLAIFELHPVHMANTASMITNVIYKKVQVTEDSFNKMMINNFMDDGLQRRRHAGFYFWFYYLCR